MQSTFSRLMVLAMAAILALVMTAACSSTGSPATEADGALQAQSVPAEGASVTSTPMPPATATAGALKTEIIEEPVSPISPVAPPTQTAAEASAQDTMELPDNLPAGSDTAVKAAVTDLAQQQAIDPATITVVSVEPMEWSDASLGCPQEGFMYAQVITPGFLVVLQAQGNTFEYHTNQSDRVVLCQP